MDVAAEAGNTLGSVAFTVAFYCWSIFISLVLIPTLPLPRPVLRAGARLWATGIAFFLRHFAGVSVEVRGRENIPEGPCIIASKHQSEWESNIFHNLLHDPVYIIKKELGRIPLYGIYGRKMKMIFIDRAGHARTLKKMVREAREAVAANRPLIIFPEGTRVNPGERIPYRRGVAALYTELGLPVVPVVHNSGLHWPKETFRKRPGTIIVRFLPPIPPGLPPHEFMRRLEDTMEGAWAGLYAEVSGRQLVENADELRRSLGD